MKKCLFVLLVASVSLAGCETTREITLNKDNSGTLVTTTDMSGMIGMIKMSGQNKNADKMGEPIDTTILLTNMTDSLDITAEEKKLARNGKIGLLMNYDDDKLIVKVEFPFSDPAQLSKLDKLSGKVLEQTVKRQMGKDTAMMMPGNRDSAELAGSIDDYFTMTYSKTVIEKKLKKDKYATVESDEAMKSLKEMSEMGVGNNTLILNLPRPVKKAEGKNVKLSDDKKKVTITNTAEDFFDDGTKLEFRIEF